MATVSVLVVMLALSTRTESSNVLNVSPIHDYAAQVVCNKTDAHMGEVKKMFVQTDERIQEVFDMLKKVTAVLNSTLVSGRCKIEARATGYDDRPRVSGYVKINDKLITNHKGRGVTLVTLTRDCKPDQVTRYDTYGSSAHGTSLKNHLLSLPPNTRIVGITYDAFYRNLGPARSLLNRYGVDLTGMAIRTSLAFALIKGQPQNTAQTTAARHRGPTILRMPSF